MFYLYVTNFSFMYLILKIISLLTHSFYASFIPVYFFLFFWHSN